ncbi:MAG TPA: tetratricopeptide repeat protein [Candidatus Dormibacteraeota bacterium]|nr:tetratricopeptide repeat protein [Candidatus Dormibacteraeota bacterium]
MPKLSLFVQNSPYEQVLEELRDNVASRQIRKGFEHLNTLEAVFQSCSPREPGGGVLLGYLAQWVDIGFGRRDLVKQLLERFPLACRQNLSVLDYVHVRMAEGLMAMSEEEYGQAAEHFAVVLALENEILEKQVISIANFWTGRCFRRQGRYDDALGYVAKARELALRLQYPKMAAVMSVLEGWIAFQEGKPEEAAKILGEAESVLLETDDHLTRGNISSAYGRIARRLGNYDQALTRFGKAIEEYSKRDPHNRNLARSFVNIAFVKRMLALQLRDKLDREAARSRKKRDREAAPATATRLKSREHLVRLRAEAFEHLRTAREIYARFGDHRGTGNVHITFAYLYLDDGELDRAASEGATAFQLGDEKKDSVLKARARILQCAVESTKFEEQIEEGSSEAPSSQLACEYAREGLQLAKHTQNRRLIAKAYVALGLALCLDFAEDMEEARQCCDEATTLLKPTSHDYVWRELQQLRRKLRGTGNINAALRDWSHGLVGGKTFQQVSDEFASIVIPKVWRREGCKVARVAARLSVSPKKVRRILRDQGLLTDSPVEDR